MKEPPLMVSVGLVFLFGSLYAILVFKDWNNVEELINLLPNFLLLGLLMGVSISGFNYSKPQISAFLMGFLTPATTFTFIEGVKLFISIASAGGTGISDPGSLSYFFYIFVISIIFGLLCTFGNYFGLRFKLFLVSTFEKNNSEYLSSERTEKHLERTIAYIALASSIITAIASVTTSLISKS